MIFLHGGVDRAQIGASLLESDAGSEAAKKLGHAMEAVSDHGGGKVMRASDDVSDDFRVGRIRDGGFEDTDDGAGPVPKETAIEANGFADDAGIFLESGGPETIGENHAAAG